MSLAQLFLLCALMTVVVHSFVADSSLLDSCDLVFFLLFMLASRQPFGVLRWFQLFCFSFFFFFFFFLVSAVCLPD